jgi:hypothetical protein
MEDGGMEGRQDEYQARMASLVGNLTGDTGLWLDAGKERKGKERKGKETGRDGIPNSIHARWTPLNSI